MSKLFYPFLFILLISLPCLSQNKSQAFTTDEGYQLQFQVTPDKDTIMLGETTFLSFEIKNLSAHSLDTTIGGDYRNNIGRPDSYGVTVVRDDGKSVPQPKVTIWQGGLIGGADIPAKGSYIKKLYLPDWATFTEAGTYLITVKRKFDINNYSTKAKNIFTVEVSTTIKIIPTDKEKLGGVIDSLGKTMLDEQALLHSIYLGNSKAEDAAILLRFIDDTRTIDYFSQALEKFGKSANFDDGYYIAKNSIFALSKYNDEATLKVLGKAMLNLSDDLRLDLADAFSRSKTAEALKLLLKMRNDSYWFVRLRVVQAYGEINSDESTALLRDMFKDENEEVRKQAQEYLNKREQK